MATQNNKKEGFGESVINWLITIYPRIGENSDKIRNCEI